MRMCQPHWDQLRSEVSKRGLDHLIPPDAESAMALQVRTLEKKDTPLDFDPLMSAFFQLTEIALNFMGISLVVGDKCPVCELHNYNWVEGAAHQSYLYAEKNGLLLDARPKTKTES